MKTQTLLITGLLLISGCQKELSEKLNTTAKSDSIISPDDSIIFEPYTPGELPDYGGGKLVCSLWEFNIIGNGTDTAYAKSFIVINHRGNSVVFTKAIIYVDGQRIKTLTDKDTIKRTGEVVDNVNKDTITFTVINPSLNGAMPVLYPFSLNGIHSMAIRMHGSGNTGDSYQENLYEAIFINKTDFPQTQFNQQGLPVEGDTCIYQ